MRQISDTEWEHLQRCAKLGAAFLSFWEDHAEWSQRTFGPDDARGPAGPAKHLAKEAAETAAAWLELQAAERATATTPARELADKCAAFATEAGDCFTLVCDLSRRGRLTPDTLIRWAAAKLEANKRKNWPPLAAQDPDAAIEHVRAEDPAADAARHLREFDGSPGSCSCTACRASRAAAHNGPGALRVASTGPATTATAPGTGGPPILEIHGITISRPGPAPTAEELERLRAGVNAKEFRAGEISDPAPGGDPEGYGGSDYGPEVLG